MQNERRGREDEKIEGKVEGREGEERKVTGEERKDTEWGKER